MAFLTDISDRFWNFVSPRKTQQRRDKAFKVPVAPNKPQIKTQTRIKEFNTHKLTPESRIRNWNAQTPDSTMSVDDPLLPPSPPTSVPRSPTDYEGDTLVGGFGDDHWDANEDTIVVDDGEYMEHQKSFNPEKERVRREKQGRELQNAGWSQDAVFLFQKLGMRGLEPLMPIDWINDFESLPEDLFTHNVDKAFIKPGLDSDYHAQLALRNLLDLGGFVRDAVLTKAPKRTAEYHVKRAVMKYNEWATKDGKVQDTWNNLSLFDVVSSPNHVHASVAEKRMINKLSNLRVLWNRALRLRADDDAKSGVASTSSPEIPTLYGIIASHTIMAFVSYIPPTDSQPPSLRTIAIFDFGHDGYDVWNSFAIAIFIIHCRNRLMQLKEYLPEAEPVMSDDPDL